MEFELKKLSSDAIPAALERAQTYRLLNEPLAAESICRDIIAVDATNQAALIELLLSLSDQFPKGNPGNIKEAEEIVSRLAGNYHQAYYRGLILERRAMAHFETRTPGCGMVVYDWLRDAMKSYEEAQACRPDGNDESILRWNTCARIIMKYPEIRDSDEEDEAKPIHMFDS